MYKDINNIIHKYHHNLKLSDVLLELKSKHITLYHNCHYCNKIKLTIKRKPCKLCSIYICDKCESIYDFNIDRMLCGFCMDDQYASICCLIFIEFVVMFMYLIWVFHNNNDIIYI